MVTDGRRPGIIDRRTALRAYVQAVGIGHRVASATQLGVGIQQPVTPGRAAWLSPAALVELLLEPCLVLALHPGVVAVRIVKRRRPGLTTANTKLPVTPAFRNGRMAPMDKA